MKPQKCRRCGGVLFRTAVHKNVYATLSEDFEEILTHEGVEDATPWECVACSQGKELASEIATAMCADAKERGDRVPRALKRMVGA